jgi:hypothetical protein
MPGAARQSSSGGIPVHAPNDNITVPRSGITERFGLGIGLAATSSRSGIRRRIWPWAYRYIRALAAVQLGSGVILAVFGALVLSQGYSGWAALMLAAAALHLWVGYLDVSVARSAHPGT